MTVLDTIPIFSSLSGAELTTLESYSVTRIYPKHVVAVNQGDATDSLYIIMSGMVKVFLSDAYGKEIIINTQGPGEYFGELALTDGAEHSASIMTMQKSTFCIISKHGFKEVLTNHPDIAISLIKELTRRVCLLTDNIKTLALLDVYGRVAKTLLGMAREHDGKLVIEDKLTQQDIANRVGASREMVSRILKDLATGGYISFEDKHIVIKGRLPQHY